MSKKIALISLGCAKNLVNSEEMLSLMDDAGYELVSSPDGADAAIVNTCAFIESAKQEAIDEIIALGALKAEGKLQKIVVCGCLSERYKTELSDEMPEIDALLGTGSYAEIVSVLDRTLAGEKPAVFGDIDAAEPESGRVVTTGPSWAYIKIAEGCSNRCAYCVIPSLRGKYRSRPMEHIMEEAEALAQSGVRELIVIAQDITRYGTDLYGKKALAELLRKLCGIEELKWIRLHYLYPDEFDDELIDTIASEEKILKYLDIPIQHINDGILKKMNRRGTGEEIRALFKKLRDRIPGLVLRTSLITGLPGEGEAEFEELCDFLREAKIERAGVFPYSPEEGTPAYDMPRVDTETALSRAGQVAALQDRVMDDFSESRLGQTVEVLCDGEDDDMGWSFGRSYAESPDIDGHIIFGGGTPGEFYRLRLTGMMDGELIGEIVKGEEL